SLVPRPLILWSSTLRSLATHPVASPVPFDSIPADPMLPWREQEVGMLREKLRGRAWAWGWAWFLAVSAAPGPTAAGAQGPAGQAVGLPEARRLWQNGRYAEALEAYDALAKAAGDQKLKPADAAKVALGRADCLASQGENDKAAEALKEALDGPHK